MLVKRSFIQNMKGEGGGGGGGWCHLNTLKPGPELTKTEAVCQPDILNICHYGF